MQRKHGIAGKALEQPLLNHALGPADVFFGGLKNQMHRAIEILRLRQVACRTQQHGGVPVMATGMHLASGARSVSQIGCLMNGKRVHVGPDADGAPAASFDKRSDNACAGNTRRHRKAELAEFLGNNLARPEFLKAKFRMHVQVMPDGGKLARRRRDLLIIHRFCGTCFSTAWIMRFRK